LLCCGSLDAAIRAMGVAAFHEFGRKVDYQAFAEQHAEIEADNVSRWGAWLGSEPYATTRIASLRHFITSHAYTAAETWFLRERDEEPPALAAPGRTTVVPSDCAGWWRRATAFVIDGVVVLAIINSFAGSGSSNLIITTTQPTSSPSASPAPATKRSPAGARDATPAPAPRPTLDKSDDEDYDVSKASFTLFGMRINVGSIVDPKRGPGKTFWFCVYEAVLVAVAGQSFGMMIAGLRVVTLDFHRPGIWRSIGRYTIVMFLWPLVVLLSFFSRRVLLHDRMTRTRVVMVERVIARVATATTS
jgi:uncharacterized RDD family membrane protein YckC